VAYSIAIDESTGVIHIEQLAVFIRTVSEDLLEEELLELFPMKRKASDDKISSQLAILLNKLRLLCERNICVL
jgi:hypothetical protein